MAEIAGIEPAPLCELTHKGKWSHSSPVTDRCTTLFCRDCTYSLGSARGTDRRHPVCVCYRPFGRPQAQTRPVPSHVAQDDLKEKEGPFSFPLPLQEGQVFV